MWDPLSPGYPRVGARGARTVWACSPLGKARRVCTRRHGLPAVGFPVRWQTVTALAVVSLFHGGHLCYSGPGATYHPFASENAYDDAGRAESPQTLWWVGRLGRGKFRGG